MGKMLSFLRFVGLHTVTTVFEGLKWLSVGCMKLSGRQCNNAELGEVTLSENRKVVQFERF
jgi:hypothetical protein